MDRSIAQIQFFETRKNLITKDELKNIWTPQIKFSLLEKDSFEQLEEQITVEKNGRPTKNNEFSISPNEVYEGFESIIEMKTLVRGVFMCPFDSIKEYPFDEEKCNLELKCNGEGCTHVNLKPGNLKVFPKSFGEYRVLPMNDTVIKIENHILMVDILLGRNIGSIFMVTYLPHEYHQPEC